MALVTGAGAGIGRAIAVAYAEAGAKVMVTDIDEEAAPEVAAAIARSGGWESRARSRTPSSG